VAGSRTVVCIEPPTSWLIEFLNYAAFPAIGNVFDVKRVRQNRRHAPKRARLKKRIFEHFNADWLRLPILSHSFDDDDGTRVRLVVEREWQRPGKQSRFV